jgi:5-formyltetrahydrofolate cyclo-ligase
MADQKHRLRKVMRDCRAALPPERAQALSRSIQARAIRLDCYRSAGVVLLYAAAGNEVATSLIADDARAGGRRLFYPIAQPDAVCLDFREVTSPDDLRPGHFGIAEPPRSAPPLAPALCAGAVVFVPAMAMGPRGQRLGRGGGFYDRFLASAGPGITAVGLVYSFQMLEDLPEQPWDRRLDYVVTELAVHETRCAGQVRNEGCQKGGVSK